MPHFDLSFHRTEKRCGVRCISTNTDSLPNKLNEIENFLHYNKIDIAAFVETVPKNCSSSEVKNLKFELEGYQCISNPKGRGVCLYLNNSFEIVKRFDEYEDTFSPSIFCKIKTSANNTFTLGVLYRSPGSSYQDNLNLNLLLQNISKKHQNSNEKLVILGDFNYPDVCWLKENCDKSNEHPASLFLNTVHESYLTQFINKPTHHRALQNPTLIDLILSNDTDFVYNIVHFPPFGKSHHSVLYFSIDIDTDSNTSPPVMKYCINKGDFQGMKTYFDAIDWISELDEDLNIDQWWDIIVNHLNEAKEKFVPKKNQSVKNNTVRTFYVPPTLLNKIRLKRTAFRTYKKFPTLSNYNTYVKYRNQVRNETRKAKINKEVKVALNAKTNPKQFFQYINKKLKPKESISNLSKEDGSMTDGDKEKCGVLNDFFASVFTKENKEDVPNFNSDYEFSISESHANVIDMEYALKHLNETKSPGPDGIHPGMLKHLSAELSLPFTLLFEKTMEEGKIPSKWKDAEVRPIFKKGLKTVPGNYRPVSLTSVVCKVFEGFVKRSLHNHLTFNNLLSKQQYGFCNGRSCVTQLLTTINDWLGDMDNKVPVDAAYLDFRKAFDTVPHKRLMSKLRGYGVRGNLLSWIEDFLSNRTQFVSINGESSERRDVTSGVPQGSVLGPTLFIYYINDLPQTVNCLLKIFADDTKAYLPITSITDGHKLQESIDKLVDWTEVWQLKFNSDKCKILHLGSNNPKFKYTITDNGNTKTLEETISEKDLGVFIDPLLTFEDHINYITKKARSLSGLIVRAITYKSPTVMVPLFKAIIRPVLEYGNAVWQPSKRKFINQIETIQRHFTKCIIGMKDLDYPERLKALNLPSLEFRRLRGDLIEMYKMTHDLYDSQTTESLFDFNTNNTRNNHFKLNKPRVNTKQYQEFFTNRVINRWNGLHDDIVLASSLNCFKNYIDSHFKDIMFCTDFEV